MSVIALYVDKLNVVVPEKLSSLFDGKNSFIKLTPVANFIKLFGIIFAAIGVLS